MATLLLEVVTPEATIVKEEVDMVTCPGSEGEFGVLPNHESLLSSLKIGALRYAVNGTETTLFVSGGFVDVHANQCSVLAEVAEKAENIDEARAMEAKQRAERRLEAKEDELDEARALSALQRAITRLKIAQKPM